MCNLWKHIQYGYDCNTTSLIKLFLHLSLLSGSVGSSLHLLSLYICLYVRWSGGNYLLQLTFSTLVTIVTISMQLGLASYLDASWISLALHFSTLCHPQWSKHLNTKALHKIRTCRKCSCPRFWYLSSEEGPVVTGENARRSYCTFTKGFRSNYM